MTLTPPSLYSSFRHQADTTPNLSCLIEGESRYCYRQILAQIDRVADNLVSNGVQPGDVVAIYSEKNIESIVSFLALSKLGASTLTLDLAFPENMLEYILTDAKVTVVLYQKNWPLTSSIPTFQFAQLNQPAPECSQAQTNTKPHWIVYSSGTTGNPKGILFSETAIVNSINNRCQFSAYKQGEHIACSIYFFWEVFRPLLNGACVHIIKESLLLNLERYIEYLHRHQISETLWTPSFAETLLNTLTHEQTSRLASLKKVWLNGEVVTKHLLELALIRLKHTDFYNLYSLSETYDVTAKKLSLLNLVDDNFATIGPPLPNVLCTVLDDHLNPCDPEIQGELYVSSSSLAECYLNAAAANAKSFIEIDGRIYFKTKDIAYKTSNDELVILGRNDHVVKLRGYNVSLIAIEDIIKRMLPVSQCVVSITGSGSASQVLTAALEVQNLFDFTQRYDIDLLSGNSPRLHQLLSEHLPHYAVPSRFMCTDKLGRSQYSAKLERNPTDLPNNLQAIELSKLWHSVLKIPIESISLQSDFFNLGGNSLQVIQLAQTINHTFTQDVSTRDLYQSPTLESQIRLISNGKISPTCPTLTALDDVHLNHPLPETLKGEPPLNLEQAQSIFITGVTGFLGAHCLSQFIAKTHSHFYCLIRAKNAAEGMKRLQATLKRYRLNPLNLKQRVTVLCGDLSQVNFGFADSQWQTLTRRINLVFHAAATVNLLYPYHRLKPSTVDGTKRLIDFSLTNRIKPFVLISSDAVLLPHSNLTQQFLPINSIQQLKYGYAQAKWVQEQLIQLAKQCAQLPYRIFRLGNLSPSLIHYGSNPADANGLLCQFIQKHRVITNDISLEFTSVDLVVSHLINRLNESIDGEIETLSHVNTVDSTYLSNLFSAANIPHANWLSLLREQAPHLAELYNSGDLFSNVRETAIISPSLRMNRDQIKQTLTLMAQGELLEEHS